MTPMNTDTDRHCIDLTQLSSREQLSALMDGALPEDQTRFLLRRLQHDDELAGSWERWRISSRSGVSLSRRRRPDSNCSASSISMSSPGGRRPCDARWFLAVFTAIRCSQVGNWASPRNPPMAR